MTRTQTLAHRAFYAGLTFAVSALLLPSPSDAARSADLRSGPPICVAASDDSKPEPKPEPEPKPKTEPTPNGGSKAALA